MTDKVNVVLTRTEEIHTANANLTKIAKVVLYSTGNLTKIATVVLLTATKNLTKIVEIHLMASVNLTKIVKINPLTVKENLMVREIIIARLMVADRCVHV